MNWKRAAALSIAMFVSSTAMAEDPEDGAPPCLGTCKAVCGGNETSPGTMDCKNGTKCCVPRPDTTQRCEEPSDPRRVCKPSCDENAEEVESPLKCDPGLVCCIRPPPSP